LPVLACAPFDSVPVLLEAAVPVAVWPELDWLELFDCVGLAVCAPLPTLALPDCDGPEAVELGEPVLELAPLDADAVPVGVIVTVRSLLAVPPVTVDLAVWPPVPLLLPVSSPAVTSRAVVVAVGLETLPDVPPLPPVGMLWGFAPEVLPITVPPATVPPPPPLLFAFSVEAPVAPPVAEDVFVAVPLDPLPPVPLVPVARPPLAFAAPPAALLPFALGVPPVPVPALAAPAEPLPAPAPPVPAVDAPVAEPAPPAPPLAPAFVEAELPPLLALEPPPAAEPPLPLGSFAAPLVAPLEPPAPATPLAVLPVE